MKTTLNGISKIQNEGGDYIVLNDYGTINGGIVVSHQAATLKDAVHYMLGCGFGESQAIVKLVRVEECDIPTLSDQPKTQPSAL